MHQLHNSNFGNGNKVSQNKQPVVQKRPKHFCATDIVRIEKVLFLPQLHDCYAIVEDNFINGNMLPTVVQ